MEFITNTEDDHLLVDWTLTPLVEHYNGITEVIGSK